MFLHQVSRIFWTWDAFPRCSSVEDLLHNCPQKEAGCYFKVCLGYQEQPYSKAWLVKIRDIKSWTFCPAESQLWWAIFAPYCVGWGCVLLMPKAFFPFYTVYFSSFPQMLILNNSLYTKFCLNICFWSAQPVTQSKALSLPITYA
jgi:hypothetical protein